MTQSICGHDRETLRRALEFANSSNLDDVSRSWPSPIDVDGAILYNVHDPAKLAAIIAEPILASGVVDLSEVEFAPLCECRIRAQGDIIAIVYRFVGAYKLGCKLLTMPQARAIALRLLDAPTATAQDIERMIGEL